MLDDLFRRAQDVLSYSQYALTRQDDGRTFAEDMSSDPDERVQFIADDPWQIVDAVELMKRRLDGADISPSPQWLEAIEQGDFGPHDLTKTQHPTQSVSRLDIALLEIARAARDAEMARQYDPRYNAFIERHLLQNAFKDLSAKRFAYYKWRINEHLKDKGAPSV